MPKRPLADIIANLSARWRTSAKTVTMKGARVRAPSLAPGDKWREFQIVSKLGEGGVGAVYHARDALDRDVALKLLDGDEAIREGKTLAQLRHPNIVAVYSYEQGAEGAALSMELIQGQSLEKFAVERGKLDPGYAALICLHLCRGLALVHSKGLVHRDIKASNVMRQQDGRIVLVDFGLGQKVDPETQRGEVAGTLPYMAPEIFQGSAASPRTDLYAVGVLLYYLVTLQYPVNARNAADFRQAHAAGGRDHLLDLRPDLPPLFISLVEKAIDPDPGKRFKSAGAMMSALEQVLHTRIRKPALLLWGLAAAVLLGGLFYLWRRWPLPGDAPPQLELMRLTSEDALSQEPSLSADGSLVAYASDEAEPGNLDIWVKQVPNGASLRLTRTPFDEATPSFSPDGHSIAFRSEKDGGGVYLIPAFGGEPKLLAQGGFMPRFSPDGKYIAYWLGELYHPRLPSGKIYVAPASGGAPRQLCPQMPDARNPVWAPDSRHILFQGSQDPNLPPDDDAEWWVAALDGSPPVNTGALGKVKAQGLEAHTNAAFWSAQYLVFSAARQANVNLWRMPFPLGGKPGAAQRLTFGTAFETAPSMSANGRLVFESSQGRLRIWRISVAQPGAQPVRITSSADFDAFPSLSRDRKLLAFSRTSSEIGIRQIWVRDLASGDESMLTSSTDPKSNPVISPSGDQLAYNVGEKESNSIYLMNRGTRESRQLCRKCGIVTAWMPTEDAILASTSQAVVRVDPSTGSSTAVLAGDGMVVDEAECSPDGRWLAFSAHAAGKERQVYVAPYGRQAEWKRVSAAAGSSDKPHWSADGRMLYLFSSSDGFQCLWSRAIDPASGSPAGPLRAVHHFHNARLSANPISQPVRGYAVSGDQLFLDLAENLASIWMSLGQK